jgi:hypothetical protein
MATILDYADYPTNEGWEKLYIKKKTTLDKIYLKQERRKKVFNY